MTKIAYYEDENVAVTSKSVRLGEKVYALRDVRYAGVVSQLPQLTIGKVRISEGLLLALIFLVVYIACIAFAFLANALLWPSLATWPVVMLFMLAPMPISLIISSMRRRRPYQVYLSIRLPGGFESALPSIDRRYLERIAKTINAAVVEDRKAKKLERPYSRMARY